MEDQLISVASRMARRQLALAEVSPPKWAERDGWLKVPGVLVEVAVLLHGSIRVRRTFSYDETAALYERATGKSHGDALSDILEIDRRLIALPYSGHDWEGAEMQRIAESLVEWVSLGRPTDHPVAATDDAFRAWSAAADSTRPKRADEVASLGLPYGEAWKPIAREQ